MGDFVYGLTLLFNSGARFIIESVSISLKLPFFSVFIAVVVVVRIWLRAYLHSLAFVAIWRNLNPSNNNRNNEVGVCKHWRVCLPFTRLGSSHNNDLVLYVYTKTYLFKKKPTTKH